MIASSGRWQPGIGDPSIMGWATVAAYLTTAVLCAICARRAQAGERHARAYWVGVALIMLLLGINKQLDLQSWFSQTARDFVISHGWYESRRSLQKTFIGALVLAGASALVWLFWIFRDQGHAARVSALGLVLLSAFVVLRAASFHHVDLLLRADLLGLRGNWILELGGISIVAAGAVARLLGSPARVADP